MADKMPKCKCGAIYGLIIDESRWVCGGCLLMERADTKALHSSIIEQGRLVQIGASGESKYGAMSDSEFIEWMLNLLEGK
jgi:hypothetical protein